MLPILRSRTQAGVLAVLLLNPEQELTQTDLAQRVGSSLTSVIDEVRRLERAGILTSRILGRARLVRAGLRSGPGRPDTAASQGMILATLTFSSWSPMPGWTVT